MKFTAFLTRRLSLTLPVLVVVILTLALSSNGPALSTPTHANQPGHQTTLAVTDQSSTGNFAFGDNESTGQPAASSDNSADTSVNSALTTPNLPAPTPPAASLPSATVVPPISPAPAPCAVCLGGTPSGSYACDSICAPVTPVASPPACGCSNQVRRPNTMCPMYCMVEE